MINTLIKYAIADVAINVMFKHITMNFPNLGKLYAIKRDHIKRDHIKLNRYSKLISRWGDVLGAPVGEPVRSQSQAIYYANFLQSAPVSEWPYDLKIKYLHVVGHQFTERY